eukprot:scaffold224228_cov21-Tisochrysis_lutea.AAC.2
MSFSSPSLCLVLLLFLACLECDTVNDCLLTAPFIVCLPASWSLSASLQHGRCVPALCVQAKGSLCTCVQRGYSGPSRQQMAALMEAILNSLAE